MSDVERRIAELEAQLAELKATVAESPARRKATSAAADEVNRRALLRRGGLAIAGAAAGGAALVATAQPAAAADGDPVVIGENNLGTSTTILRTTGPNQTLDIRGRLTAPFGPAPLRITQQLQTNYTPTRADGWGDTGSLASVVRADGAADLWYAHAGEDKTAANQNEWGRVQTSQNSNYLQFLQIPARVVNTRSGAPVADSSTTTFTLSTAPADAVGAMGTITLVDASAPGAFLSVYNGSLATIASPEFSHVNGGPGVNAATTFVVALPAAKTIKVYAFRSCHILIDIAAWVVTGPRP